MTINELLALVSKHLPHLHSGKVRETFGLLEKGDDGSELRLPIPTNRRSIFDFQLGFAVEDVGEVLNASNLACRLAMTKRGIPHDLLTFGCEIDRYLPKELRGIPLLQKLAPVVMALDMDLVEMVGRNWLTGSGIRQYNEADEDGKPKRLLSGQLMPEGLIDGSPLPAHIENPTDKAPPGYHDTPITLEQAEELSPGITIQGAELGEFLTEYVQADGKLMFVDWKGERGRHRIRGERMWADEICTPDCTRIWVRSAYEAIWPRGIPPSKDKEALRNWGRRRGIDKLDIAKIEDREKAKTFKPAPEELATFRRQNHQFFEMLHGITVEEFQREVMGIAA